MKQFHRVAFTLTELLIVFIFTGFIVVLGTSVLNKKRTNYEHLYYNVYNTLRKVAYNVYADTYCPDPESSDEECQKGPREFPVTADKLCSRLAEYINVQDAKCSTFENVSNLADNISVTYDANKVETTPTLMFKTSNATKFFMDGTLYNYKIGQNQVEYFILYVDINGDAGPNIIDKPQNKNLFPDIVPFGITRRGEIIPMGYPIYSKAYLSAYVLYADGQFSDPMTYDDAIHEAWANSSGNVVKDIDIPFTYLLTNALNKKNLAKKFFASEVASLPIRQANISKGCKVQTYECNVYIDKCASVRN